MTTQRSTAKSMQSAKACMHAFMLCRIRDRRTPAVGAAICTAAAASSQGTDSVRVDRDLTEGVAPGHIHRGTTVNVGAVAKLALEIDACQGGGWKGKMQLR